MADSKRVDVKRLPRPQYLPERGLPEKKPTTPGHVPPLPPDMYLPETGRPERSNEK